MNCYDTQFLEEHYIQESRIKYIGLGLLQIIMIHYILSEI